MAEPEHIVEAAARLLAPQDLAGQRVVVSAGGTCEDLDPVRFLSNRSTGKMGYAVARAAWRRGAEVVLVSAPTSLATPLGVERVDVRSAQQMCDAVLGASESAQVTVMAAAVADYRPVERADHKLKKEGWGDRPVLELERTTDILATLGSQPERPFLVGFAAETEDMARAAADKRRAKGCDLLVGNDVAAPERGFGAETNEVLLLWEGGERRLSLASKDDIAWGICDAIVERLGTGGSRE
jgi:phosphopantothenoylcysteine decarboxylase/phosphopantothenate--cysteine ligase